MKQYHCCKCGKEGLKDKFLIAIRINVFVNRCDECKKKYPNYKSLPSKPYVPNRSKEAKEAENPLPIFFVNQNDDWLSSEIEKKTKRKKNKKRAKAHILKVSEDAKKAFNKKREIFRKQKAKRKVIQIKNRNISTKKAIEKIRIKYSFKKEDSYPASSYWSDYPMFCTDTEAENRMHIRQINKGFPYNIIEYNKKALKEQKKASIAFDKNRVHRIGKELAYWADEREWSNRYALKQQGKRSKQKKKYTSSNNKNYDNLVTGYHIPRAMMQNHNTGRTFFPYASTCYIPSSYLERSKVNGKWICYIGDFVSTDNDIA